MYMTHWLLTAAPAAGRLTSVIRSNLVNTKSSLSPTPAEMNDLRNRLSLYAQLPAATAPVRDSRAGKEV